MKVAIVYLMPLDGEPEFARNANVWADSYRQFNPGCDHRLVVCMSNGTPTDLHRAVFDGIKCEFDLFQGGGWDIGAYQFMAGRMDDDFVVMMNARTHFWKDGWLKRFVDARFQYGEGLYGYAGSYEAYSEKPKRGKNPHIRTACFGLNPKILRRYPYRIDSRHKGFLFESGPWSMTQWYEDLGLPVLMVTWDGVWKKDQWRTPPNIFRRGDQSNCLVRDRHTDMYDAVSPAVRASLEHSADFGMQS